MGSTIDRAESIFLDLSEYLQVLNDKVQKGKKYTSKVELDFFNILCDVCIKFL